MVKNPNLLLPDSTVFNKYPALQNTHAGPNQNLRRRNFMNEKQWHTVIGVFLWLKISHTLVNHTLQYNIMK